MDKSLCSCTTAGFTTSAVGTLGADNFLWLGLGLWAFLGIRGIRGCWKQHPCHPLDAVASPSCDNQKHPHTLSSVPWGEELPLLEKHRLGVFSPSCLTCLPPILAFFSWSGLGSPLQPLPSQPLCFLFSLFSSLTPYHQRICLPWWSSITLHPGGDWSPSILNFLLSISFLYFLNPFTSGFWQGQKEERS